MVVSRLHMKTLYVVIINYWLKKLHYVKSVQIRSFSWSVFYPAFGSISPYSVRMQTNTD